MLLVVEAQQRVSEHQCISGQYDSTYGTSSGALDFDIANGVTPLMYSALFHCGDGHHAVTPIKRASPLICAYRIHLIRSADYHSVITQCCPASRALDDQAAWKKNTPSGR